MADDGDSFRSLRLGVSLSRQPMRAVVLHFNECEIYNVLSLVTGGAGFLGSHLVDTLLAQGDDVIIADSLSTGSLGNVDAALRGGRATFVYLDLVRPAREIREVIMKAARSNRISRIFHIAATSPASYYLHPWEALCATGVGTVALVDLAVNQRARLVYASICEASGERLSNSPTEQTEGFDPMAPLSWYQAGRRLGEVAVAVAATRRGLDARIVRLSDCYGPRMSRADDCIVSAFAEAILTKAPLPIDGDPLETRSMLYVEDAIRLLLIVADAHQAQLTPVYIGSEEEHTILEIAESFARIAGTRFEIEHTTSRAAYQHRPRFNDLTLAHSMGCTASTTLSEGLAKTLSWLRENSIQYV